MRFTDLQKREIIEAGKGRFLGYVQDTVVNVTEGRIEALLISDSSKLRLFSGGDKEFVKIKIEDIIVIGKDVILVKDQYNKH
jgi:YlmC/YmxH family sporulation protein